MRIYEALKSPELSNAGLRQALKSLLDDIIPPYLLNDHRENFLEEVTEELNNRRSEPTKGAI